MNITEHWEDQRLVCEQFQQKIGKTTFLKVSCFKFALAKRVLQLLKLEIFGKLDISDSKEFFPFREISPNIYSCK